MSKQGGISSLGLLGIAFVVLKLTGVIDWSWWYVTLPFWIGIALTFVILAIIMATWILKDKYGK